MRSRAAFLIGLGGIVVSCALPSLLFWPFPFVQHLDAVPLEYALWRWSALLTALFAALGLVGLVGILRGRWGWRTVAWGVPAVCLTGGACYLGYAKAAATMFRPMEAIVFAHQPTDLVPAEAPILGISTGEQARAYPLSLMAYHHVFQDELANSSILITYCILCRTARAFEPTHDGKRLHFRVIGALRYNAILEDAETRSWWYQATGRAIAGPLKGARLREIALETMTLARWREIHPHSDVLQPDSVSGHMRKRLTAIDAQRPEKGGDIRGQWLTVLAGDSVTRAYPWPVVSGRRLIQDDLDGLPIAVYYHEDGYSHRVWSRRLGDRVLDLRLDHEANVLVDESSGTSFGFDGMGHGGELGGQRLERVASTSEYRYSFEEFRDGELWVDPVRGAEPEGGVAVHESQ